MNPTTRKRISKLLLQPSSKKDVKTRKALKKTKMRGIYLRKGSPNPLFHTFHPEHTGSYTFSTPTCVPTAYRGYTLLFSTPTCVPTAYRGLYVQYSHMCTYSIQGLYITVQYSHLCTYSIQGVIRSVLPPVSLCLPEV